MPLLWYSVTATENELGKLVSRREAVAKVAPDWNKVMVRNWRHLEEHKAINGATTATLGGAEKAKERLGLGW